jgi:hypothetical protein
MPRIAALPHATQMRIRVLHRCQRSSIVTREGSDHVAFHVAWTCRLNMEIVGNLRNSPLTERNMKKAASLGGLFLKLLIYES